ncbi:MAG: acetolactate synthase 2 catalytic subunit [Alphaproteobacteria bacterium]|nr:MAG: acetolactate synthase 2 catalytic subunit [Alphaproteobacteria bacterium]
MKRSAQGIAATTAPAASAASSATWTGAEALVRSLEAQGVEVVFGYPGGAIMPVYDALVGARLSHILTRHEQGAVFAADAYARVSGRVGVCLATSGPGGTNLVTGLANAHLDSVPLVAITGQVARPLIGTDAFQEVDIFGITLPIVKHSFLVTDPEEIPEVIAEAFRIAIEGRPGPVLIDLPKDVAQASVRAREFPPQALIPAAPMPMPEDIARAEAMIAASRRPLLYVGGGVAIADAQGALRDFVRRTGIPAVATLKGLGSLPSEHPLFLGMLGMHGMRAANLAVQECDLLICCGARFDDRATGRIDGFAPRAKVLHLDIDPAEVGKLKAADHAVIGGMALTLDSLDPGALPIGDWQDRISELKLEHAWRYDAPGDGIYAPHLLKRLSERAGDDFIVTCDVGQHQMWVAQHCRLPRPQAHVTSGGLGAMGFGIPAGIGALYAEPDASVVTVTGDGSIMMNIQELATLKRYGLPLKIVLLDNETLGMVRQWQDLFFAGKRSQVELSDNPDFAAVARAFGIPARTLLRRTEAEDALDWLLANRGPALLHVKIDPDANVWPLVPPGARNDEMMEETREEEKRS